MFFWGFFLLLVCSVPEITETQYREKIHRQSEVIARLNRNMTRLQYQLDKLLAQSRDQIHSQPPKAITDREHSRNGKKESKTGDRELPPIYMITPTYARWTQKADLTRLSQTLMHVPNLHWIVVEDAEEKTKLVTDFLFRRKRDLRSTHLNVRTAEGKR